MSLARAQLSVKFTLARLREQMRQFDEDQYPGNHSGPRKWLAIVGGLLDTSDQYLAASIKPNIDIDHALQLVNDAAQLASAAYTLLRRMDGTTVDKLAYPLVQPLQRWFSQLGLSNTTIFRSELVANYELATVKDAGFFLGIRFPSQTLLDAANAISWPLHMVTVPSDAYAILPHFAIVAHEIGHALYPKITWDVSGLEDERKELTARICSRMGGIDKLDPDTNSAFQRIFWSWFEELAADAFAYYLTGPAIFFSLSDFLQLLSGGYGLSKSHPANDLRRQILYEKLLEGGEDSFGSVFHAHTGHALHDDFNSVLMIRTPSSDDIYQDKLKIPKEKEVAAILAEMHGSISKAVPVIYDTVRDYLLKNASDAIYTVQQYKNDLATHLEPILSAIPPLEVGNTLDSKRPAEFASILNVGWSMLLTKLPELRVKVDDDAFDSKKLECLHGLLLKAVELSEARRDWMGV